MSNIQKLFPEVLLHDTINAENFANVECFYMGIDMTAADIHIGTLLMLSCFKKLLAAGKKVILLFGGFTTTLGDPSDKLGPRKAASDIRLNQKGILKTIVKFLGFKLRFVDNITWLSGMSLSEFLYYSAQVSLRSVLAREFVEIRLAGDHPISVADILYANLQGIDFLHLYRTHNCLGQIGGQDQWTNILQGTKFIKQITGDQGVGILLKLLTDNQGRKISKSTHPNLMLRTTHPYKFYNSLMHLPDEVVSVLNEAWTGKSMQDQNREDKHIFATWLLESTRGPNTFKRLCNVKAPVDSRLSAIIAMHIGVSHSKVKKLIEDGKILLDNKIIIDSKMRVPRGKSKIVLSNNLPFEITGE